MRTRVLLPYWVTLVNICSNIVDPEAFEIWYSIGAIRVEVEIGYVCQAGHWKEAEMVTTLWATGVSASV